MMLRNITFISSRHHHIFLCLGHTRTYVLTTLLSPMLLSSSRGFFKSQNFMLYKNITLFTSPNLFAKRLNLGHEIKNADVEVRIDVFSSFESRHVWTLHSAT